MEFFKWMHKKYINKFSAVILCLLTFLIGVPPQIYASPSINEFTMDTIDDFKTFLNSCSLEERIQLMQSLKGVDIKLKDEYFGLLSGLPALEHFTTNKKEATATKPFKPQNFNQVLPETVADAIKRGFLKEDLFSSESIRKELLWRRYNKLNYIWYDENNIDYHTDIVKWVAEKKNIEKEQINSLPTYALERKISEKFFAEIWDKLDANKRHELLKKIEKETNSSVGDITAIAQLGGVAAIATLSTTVAFMGFTFYTTMSTVICTVAGWFNVTLPFAVYMGASSTVSILAGPIGWIIAGGLVITSGVILTWREVDTVAVFIMTVNSIKAKHLR